MPVYEYKCPGCLCISEHYQTKCDGGPEYITCKICRDSKAFKIISKTNWKFGGLMTPGGPVWDEKDRDMGVLTGDHQEESEKEIRDYNKAKRQGKEWEYLEKISKDKSK